MPSSAIRPISLSDSSAGFRRRAPLQDWRRRIAWRFPPLLVAVGVAVFFAIAPSAGATDEVASSGAVGGQVQIPIEVYNRLVALANDSGPLVDPAPAKFALGRAQVSVKATGPSPSGAAEVQVDLSIDIFEDSWVLVPVLPSGTAVESASVGGQPVQLVGTPQGLAWLSKSAGSHRMILRYRVDATTSATGSSLPVPLPQAASIALTATLPGTGLDVSVIPAAGVTSNVSGNNTRVGATIPTSAGVQIAWRVPNLGGHAISRALYRGTLAGDAVTWTCELDVEVFGDTSSRLKLLPRTVTLNNVSVDGRDTSILVEGDRFAATVAGRGRHKVVMVFQVPVLRAEGPPRIQLAVPQVPVSRFDLTLPGKKEVSVTPASSVAHESRGGKTLATAYAPMSSNVAFSWAEAVPEDARTELRANASVFHNVHAEEGALYVQARVLYEITRGKTNLIRVSVPSEVQVNRITSASGAIADWRAADVVQGGLREITVFLDREVADQLVFDVEYDRSLSEEDLAGLFAVPLTLIEGTHRSRGMIALLTSRELALTPGDVDEVTRVGENQIPAFAREGVERAVSHTFKFVDKTPALEVTADAPERLQGKFDAQVDTLISLGEVTLGGAATVEIDLKSGSIMELELEVPNDVNVLNLTGPSIRTYRVDTEPSPQRIHVQFTQDMEGQFRLDVEYERILAEGEGEQQVPTLRVLGAEVEQGRVAVEALSAVEVQASRAEQLTSLDVAELPQQLVLRTTNPILLAYKYVQTEEPHELAVQVTRHRLLDVQEATIDEASYRTLFTKDGLAVTIANFAVRNSSKQFLRVRLPKQAEIWSAFVDGSSEQPALDENDSGNSVLLKIVNSTDSFPVVLIYATPGSRIKGLGSVRSVLPEPDILVTHSRWDVFLPADLTYGTPSSNMDFLASGETISGDEVQAKLGMPLDEMANAARSPLQLTVPTRGVHFAFEKLYANQSERDSWIRVRYTSSTGHNVAAALSVLGAVMFWLGVFLLVRRRPGVTLNRALLMTAVGGMLVLVTVGIYGASVGPFVWTTLVLALGMGGFYGFQQRAGRVTAEP